MNLNLEHFKDLLIKEKAVLEKDLSGLGHKVSSSDVWESDNQAPVDNADREDVASNIEEFEEKNDTLRILETQLAEVNHALQKIEDGTFGICEVSKEPIELDRLEANPSARTCKSHMND
jgi:RNA polymerase-binding transcription factor DksA